MNVVAINNKFSASIESLATKVDEKDFASMVEGQFSHLEPLQRKMAFAKLAREAEAAAGALRLSPPTDKAAAEKAIKLRRAYYSIYLAASGAVTKLSNVSWWQTRRAVRAIQDAQTILVMEDLQDRAASLAEKNQKELLAGLKGALEEAASNLIKSPFAKQVISGLEGASKAGAALSEGVALAKAAAAHELAGVAESEAATSLEASVFAAKAAADESATVGATTDALLNTAGTTPDQAEAARTAAAAAKADMELANAQLAAARATATHARAVADEAKARLRRLAGI